MVATLATVLLLAAPAQPARGGALLALSRPSQTRAVTSTVEQPTPLRWPRAPSAVLAEAEAPPRPMRRAIQLALPVDLETFAGTVCLKGAWTLRAARILEDESELGHPRWQMEISPAVVGDGARFLPGIGAVTRF